MKRSSGIWYVKRHGAWIMAGSLRKAIEALK